MLSETTTKAGLRTWLGVTDRQIARWAAMGAPKSRVGRYDRRDYAMWLDMTPSISKAVKIIARKFLADHQVKAKPPAATKPKKVSLGKKGIKEAVERLRTEEVEAHARYTRARADNNPMAANLLEEWRDSCEFLSKAEPALLKFLKECGEVAPVVEFDKYMAKTLQAIKSAFLALPSKLAPTLEGLEWPKIQKTLEAEMEAVFARVSN